MGMKPSTRWLARLEDRQSGEVVAARVCHEESLPNDHSVVEVIDDPFADPRGDARQISKEAPAKASAPLGAFLATHRFVVPLRPGKIIGIGRNFRDHAQELGHEVPSDPLLFLKAASALALSGDRLELPRGFERIDMEAELVLVITSPAERLTLDRASGCVGALTMGNDISCRDLQRKQPQWVLAKSMNGFAPIGRWLRMVDGLPPPELRVQGYKDQTLVQDAPISDMVFDLPTLLVAISKSMRLECGDMIMTGTPAGVTPLQPGMVSRVRAEGMVLAEVETPVY